MIFCIETRMFQELDDFDLAGMDALRFGPFRNPGD